MYFTRGLSILAIFAVANAQDLGVPTSWRKFSNTRSLSERITIAQNGISSILPQLNTGLGEFNGIGYWQSGNVWSVLANKDHFAGTNTNQANVVTYLNKVFGLYAHFDKYQWWAEASLYAYRAYGDTTILAHAIDTWNHVTGYVVTTAQASAGKNPNKSFTIPSTCEGATMAGGVFWRPTTDDQSINSITTGLYLKVSASLAEITGDVKYKNAAILSAQWIKAHNINANNLVLDTVNGHDCTRSAASWLFTYNSGKYIEGLSILADVTGDASWKTLLTNIVASAVKTSVWEGSDGIITEGAKTASNDDSVGFKAIFIRGLNEAFVRNPSQGSLAILIHSYVDVQYNALLDLAANGSTYSANWHGPAQGFTTWGQLAALDPLTAAISANT